MAQQKEFTRLSDRDFEVLFPQRVITIGETKVTVEPLNLHDTNYFAACLRAEWPQLMIELHERGITEMNVEERLLDLADILVSRSPMLIAILTSVHPEDAARLPIVSALELLDAVFEVNLRDRDFFTIVSNVRRVAERITAALETNDPAGGSERSATSPQHSSKKGTRGGKFKRTRGDNSARSTSPQPT